jgi:hypothetical protein
VLRRIFGPKRDEETGSWRKLHNEELHNLYSSPSIIRMIKSRRMRWARARMGRIGIHIGYWWEIQKERYHWEDQDVGGWGIREIGWDDVDWIDMAQESDHWRSLVNTVLNLWLP